jgi:hypothetical protein
MLQINVFSVVFLLWQRFSAITDNVPRPYAVAENGWLICPAKLKNKCEGNADASELAALAGQVAVSGCYFILSIVFVL